MSYIKITHVDWCIDDPRALYQRAQFDESDGMGLLGEEERIWTWYEAGATEPLVLKYDDAPRQYTVLERVTDEEPGDG